MKKKEKKKTVWPCEIFPKSEPSKRIKFKFICTTWYKKGNFSRDCLYLDYCIEVGWLLMNS